MLCNFLFRSKKKERKKRPEKCEMHPPNALWFEWSRFATVRWVLLRIHGKAGMQGDSWGPSQHTGPLNEKNDQLSPALLKTHLHPVRFHYGWGPATELQDRTESECTDRAGQAPIGLTRLTGPIDSWFSCVKVFWLLYFFFLPVHFPHYLWVCSWQRAGDYQSAWNPAFALLYNYCTVCSPKSISREDYVC